MLLLLGFVFVFLWGDTFVALYLILHGEGCCLILYFSTFKSVRVSSETV